MKTIQSGSEMPELKYVMSLLATICKTLFERPDTSTP